MRLSKCPKCKTHAYEVLSTHSYCLECNFSPDFIEKENSILNWALKEIRDAVQFAKSGASYNICQQPLGLA